MTSTPLRSSDYARLVISAFLLVLIHVGAIVPVVLLVYAIMSAKVNRDFTHVEKAVGYCKVYFWVLAASVVITQLFLVVSGERDLIYFVPVPIVGLIIYLTVLKKLILEPLSLHRGWVQDNGLFQRKRPSSPQEDGAATGAAARISSSADELVKLAQLKMDGHISDLEFDQLKKALLSAN